MKQNLTPKQKKLVTLLKQTLLDKTGTKTLAELMIMAGYSDKTAINPSAKVLNAPVVQNELKEFIDLLDEKAKMAFNALTQKKIDNSSGRDVAYIGDIVVKNKQLLSGNATERKSINIEISEEIAKKNL